MTDDCTSKKFKCFTNIVTKKIDIMHYAQEFCVPQIHNFGIFAA